MAQIDSYTAKTAMANTDQFILQETASGLTKKTLFSSFKSSLGLIVGEIKAYDGIDLPAGTLLCDSSALSRTTYSPLYNVITKSLGTFTTTIATPGVITLSTHGFSTGDNVELTTTGALPTGLVVNTNYYVIYIDANSFNLATTRANAVAGTKIATSGSQSGVHSLRYTPWGISTSANFLLPDRRGGHIRGAGVHGTEQMANGNYYDGGHIGVPELDQSLGHKHLENVGPSGTNGNSGSVNSSYRSGLVGGSNAGYASTTQANSVTITTEVTDGVNGTPRPGDENNPFNLPTKFIIKYE